MLQHAPIFVNILQWAYPNAKICFLLGKYESIRIKNCTEVSFKTMLEECKISSSLPELLLHLHYVKRFWQLFCGYLCEGYGNSFQDGNVGSFWKISTRSLITPKNYYRNVYEKY